MTTTAAYNEADRITEWFPADSKVELSFHECRDCGSMAGFAHMQPDCPGQRRQWRLRKVTSCYGDVTFLQWCRAEQIRLLLDGIKTTLHDKADDYGQPVMCLCREGK